MTLLAPVLKVVYNEPPTPPPPRLATPPFLGAFSLSLSVLSAQYNGLYTILCTLNQSRLTTMLKSGP